jgi:hypothetical protein
MATFVPAGPTTLQLVKALEPTAKSVKPPTGTVGVSKLPLSIGSAFEAVADPPSKSIANNNDGFDCII